MSLSPTGREIEVSYMISAHIHELLNWRFSELVKTARAVLTPKLYNPLGLDPFPMLGKDVERADLNYEFGAALHETKHPDAKPYHRLSQAGKEKFRKAFQRRAESTSPHMAKHRAAWTQYQDNLRIAEVTAKLSRPEPTFDADVLWP